MHEMLSQFHDGDIWVLVPLEFFRACKDLPGGITHLREIRMIQAIIKSSSLVRVEDKKSIHKIQAIRRASWVEDCKVFTPTLRECFAVLHCFSIGDKLLVLFRRSPNDVKDHVDLVVFTAWIPTFTQACADVRRQREA
jgi:hypothetical protein